MVKTTIEKMSHSIGYDIGMSDDVVQSDLLNGFCEALYNSMTDNHKREMQICYIVDKLTNKSIEIITEMVEFIKVKGEK